jgi:outer membrane protein assembly factor BamB
MTPEEVDALLERIPPFDPSPRLRKRVLGDIDRRLAPRSLKVRFALAVSLVVFASILWVILPRQGRPGQGAPFLQPRWETATNRQEISRMTLAVARVYVETPDHFLLAIDRFTGRILWTQRIATPTPPDWPPVEAQGVADEIVHLDGALQEIERRLANPPPDQERLELERKRAEVLERRRFAEAGDNVYVVSGQALSCIDRATGALRWTRGLAFKPSAQPVAIRNYVFVTDGAAGRVRALDVEKQGEEVESYASDGESPIYHGPAYADPSLYFVSEAGTFHCYNVTNGNLTYRYFVGPGKGGGPLIHTLRYCPPDRKEGERPRFIRLAITWTGSRIHVADADAGTMLWQYDCGSAVRELPTIKDGRLYVATEGATLHALELLPLQPDGRRVAAGRLHWKLPGMRRFLVKGRDGIHVLDEDQQITTVRESSGEIVGRHPLNPCFILLTNPSDGDFYAVKPGGIVVCLREAP